MGWQGSGGGFKVQRGVASAAGIVIISEVNMEKAFVISVSKGSAGTVAASGTVSAASISSGAISGSTTGSLTGSVTVPSYNSSSYSTDTFKTTSWPVSLSGTRTLTGTVTGMAVSASSISGGSTNLTVREYSARLISPTELTVDGPCEWQVVESE